MPIRPDDQRSIGYLVRALDDALDEAVSRALGRFGLSRLDWQLLTVVRSRRLGGPGSVTPSALQRELLAHPDEVVDSLRGLRARRLLDDDLELSADGEALYLKAWHSVGEVGATLDRDVSGEDHETTTAVLRQMLTNLLRAQVSAN